MSYELTKVPNSKIAEFGGIEPDYEAKLDFHDPRKNSNKFWHIRVYGNHIVRHWGRHGSKGQQSCHRTWSEWGAKSAAQDLEDQKRNKGYKTDNTTALDLIVRKIDG